MALTISAERNIYGAWVLAAIIDGARVQRVYMGYTKREAFRMFRDEFKGKD